MTTVAGTVLTKWFHRIGWLIGGTCVAWWLFAGTVAHYRPISRDPHAIRFAHFGSYADFELWRNIIEAFQASHADIHVQQEYVPGWYGRYDAKIRQQILSGTLPHVVMMQLGPFANMARHFAVLGPYVIGCPTLSKGGGPNSIGPSPAPERDGAPTLDAAAELDATALRAFTIATDQDGREYLRGLPIAGGNLLIYCNPDCFAAAGAFHGHAVPLPEDDWTMEQFAAVAGELTCDYDGDGQLDQWGFWLPRWVYYLPFMWSFGAEAVDADQTRWALTGPTAEKAFRFYRDLARDRRVCPRPAEVPQLIQDVGFLTGRVAMCVNGPWFEPFLDRTALRDTYRVVHIPGGLAGRATRVTWDGLCIADGLTEAQKLLAWRFVRFCVSETAQGMIAASGRSIPARRASLSAYDRSGSDPRRRKFVQALAYSRLQPRSPRFSEIDRAIGRHLQRFIDDDSALTPAEFLARLAEDRAIVGAFVHTADRQR